MRSPWATQLDRLPRSDDEDEDHDPERDRDPEVERRWYGVDRWEDER